MKNAKSFALGFILAAALAFSGAGFAQSTTQNEGKKHESCCAMESCCKSGSCSMKHGEKQAQKKESKEHSHQDGCCCCSDSCQMKAQDKQKQG